MSSCASGVCVSCEVHLEVKGDESCVEGMVVSKVLQRNSELDEMACFVNWCCRGLDAAVPVAVSVLRIIDCASRVDCDLAYRVEVADMRDEERRALHDAG